jgi:outer membrane receptor protein involved in Fe transport
MGRAAVRFGQASKIAAKINILFISLGTTREKIIGYELSWAENLKTKSRCLTQPTALQAATSGDPTMTFKRLITAALSAYLFAAFSSIGFAQSATDGAIGGTIVDRTGSAVPAAKVVIHSNDTNLEQAATADSEGSFRVTHLAPGSYTVTITAAGFDTYKAPGAVVEVGLVTTLEPHLVVGSSETIVDVSSEVPALNFTSPDFAANLNAQTIDDLPINGRRWSDLALLTPGVVADANGFGLLSFRGISPLLNNIEIDGADDNQAFFSEERGRTREGYSTSQASVREFQVNTGVYSAEYGRAAGGVVNSVTKSGTNKLHGELYFYDRDNDFGATNPFTTNTVATFTSGNPIPTGFLTGPYKPKDWRKEWGGALGGPLLKDKLFWFYSYDQYKRNFPGTAKPVNPTAFFTVPDATLPTGQTCNPVTGATTTTSGTVSTIDSAACTLTARLSLGSYSAGSSLYNTDLAGVLSDLGTVPRTGDQVINTPKLDWQINGKQHASFLFHRLRWDSPGGVQTQATNNYAIDSFGTDFVKLDYGLARLETLITNNVSNEVRYQYSRELNDEGSQTQSAYTKAHFVGTSGIPVGVGLVTSTGLTEAGIPYYSFRYAYPDERKWQISDTATWNHGQHSVKAGVDMVHNYNIQNNLFESNGIYSYSSLQNFFADIAQPNGTCNSTASATGVATTANGQAASAIFPCYTNIQQGFGSQAFDLATMDYGFFAQDDWKVSPRLTLNLGLRYDYESLPNPYSKLIASELNNYPGTSNRPSDKNDLGPRIGFAYDPFGIGKTVIRGGYGMYFGRVFNAFIFNTYLNVGSPIGQNTQTFKNTVRQTGSTTVPLAIFPNQVSPTAYTGTTPNIEYFAPNFQNPMVHEFDLTVQQDIGHGSTVAVTYLGALGRELPNYVNTNLNPATMYSSTLTIQQTATIVGASGACGPLACGSQITSQVFASPLTNPLFGATTEVISNVNSSYNGLVGEVKNTSSKYLKFDLNYTWSHALDFNQNSSTSPGTNNFLNPYASQRQNYGNSNFNVPNRLVGYAMITFPAIHKGWLDYVVNGWDVNPLMQMQNGLPYSAGLSGFQPGASFSSGITGSGVTFLPQAGRNAFQQKRTKDFDVRLEKEIKVHEGYDLQLIGEGFNLANHQNVTSVNTTAYTFSGSTLVYNGGLAGFGGVSNANSNYVYSPRQIQLAVRLEF